MPTIRLHRFAKTASGESVQVDYIDLSAEKSLAS